MRIALARFEWKLADCWVGVFWKTRPAIWYSARFNDPWLLDVWICLIPCVPFHLRLERPAIGKDGREWDAFAQENRDDRFQKPEP